MSVQLNIWRLQAFKRLTQLINDIQGATSPKDALIDQLIRSLSKLPARPADKLAYVGIFGVNDASAGRKKAVEQLRDLATTLTGDLSPNDGLIDDTIRALTDLPKRPIDKQPYASLFAEPKMRWLTPQILQAIAPKAPAQRLTQLVPELNRTMVEFEISTPLRQAHFLAQVLHESDQLNALEEYASGEAYEWRSDLGNVYAGDGIRFKGRGLIQITGRKNYRECGKALGIDLIANPKQLTSPVLASLSAGWYWEARKLNPVADRDDIDAVTRVINGGYNGYEDRVRLLARAKKVL